MKGFTGGIHPPYRKDSSQIHPIKKASSPSVVTIPLVQHIGAPAQPIVKVGDAVKVGTRIGEAQGFISAHVHASVSGTVKKIDCALHPVLGMAQAVVIESDGADDYDAGIQPCENGDALSPEDIVSRVKDAGLVGLGGAAFPTHVKLMPPKGKTIDTLIINGAECEPYLTCDHMLMLFSPIDVIRGAALAMKAVGAKQCYIGIEKNKMDAVELLRSKIRSLNIEGMVPIELPVKYPQGSEKQLIKAITDREVPLGGLPMDVGIVVMNVGTARSVFDAVVNGKPLYERMVTVCGKCVKQSQNVLVRIGTSFADTIKEVGGLINEPRKVIMGGPMMGMAQSSLDVPVVKATSGILTFNRGEYLFPRVRPCIRCGRCVDVCPMGLVPNMITLAGEKKYYDRAVEFGVRDCMECGSCAYACPAKRPMVQSIKMVKAALQRQAKK